MLLTKPWSLPWL